MPSARTGDGTGAPMMIGPALLLAAVVAAVFISFRIRTTPGMGRSTALLRYFGGVLGVAVLGYAAGAAAGVYAACSADDAGNLCGLSGVLGVGPAAAAVAIIVYAVIALRREP